MLCRGVRSDSPTGSLLGRRQTVPRHLAVSLRRLVHDYVELRELAEGRCRTLRIARHVGKLRHALVVRHVLKLRATRCEVQTGPRRTHANHSRSTLGARARLDREPDGEQRRLACTGLVSSGRSSSQDRPQRRGTPDAPPARSRYSSAVEFVTDRLECLPARTESSIFCATFGGMDRGRPSWTPWVVPPREPLSCAARSGHARTLRTWP